MILVPTPAQPSLVRPSPRWALLHFLPRGKRKAGEAQIASSVPSSLGGHEPSGGASLEEEVEPQRGAVGWMWGGGGGDSLAYGVVDVDSGTLLVAARAELLSSPGKDDDGLGAWERNNGSTGSAAPPSNGHDGVQGGGRNKGGGGEHQEHGPRMTMMGGTCVDAAGGKEFSGHGKLRLRPL